MEGFREHRGDGFIFFRCRESVATAGSNGEEPSAPGGISVEIHLSGSGVAEPNERPRAGRTLGRMRDASSAAGREWLLRTANTLLVRDWPMAQKPGIVFRRIG